MPIEVAHLSASNLQTSARLTKPLQSETKGHRSVNDLSSLKSYKFFQDSLRSKDLINSANDEFKSLKQSKVNYKIPKFLVDLTKKIKKVEIPFTKFNSCRIFQQNLQSSEKNALISSQRGISFQLIDPILQTEVQAQSLIIIQNPLKIQSVDFRYQQFSVDQMSNNIDLKVNSHKEYATDSIIDQYQLKNSRRLSFKSKSINSMRLKRKKKKNYKKIRKVENAKSIQKKLNHIANYFDELHQKVVYTKRQKLVEELNMHLFEPKLRRLRKQLKRLL